MPPQPSSARDHIGADRYDDGGKRDRERALLARQSFRQRNPGKTACRSTEHEQATRLFMCHDYKAPGRDQYEWETTVGEEKARNVHLRQGVSEDDFVTMRESRDATLAAPLLLLPSIQVNIRAGKFPPAESNGVHYLRLPVKLAS